MTLLFHTINILFAFPGLLFYNFVTRKKLQLSTAGVMFISSVPVLLMVIGNVILCYVFFTSTFLLKWFELITSFLLVYITLHYSRLHNKNKYHELFIENLQIAKDHAEIEALKLQLHPHFLFNSLNTLHHLIKPENEEARKYLQLLADVYRYILKNKTKELVLLEDELKFSRQYFYLLSIRYGQAIHFNINIDSIKADDYLVIPISIQILIENAIKHNHFTVEAPLDLVVSIDDEFVTVKNEVNRISSSASLKIGLKNLSERSLIITNKPLIIESTGNAFTVRLPLIKYK